MKLATRRRPLLALAALAALGLGACVDEGENLIVRPAPCAVTALFARTGSAAGDGRHGTVVESVNTRVLTIWRDV